MQLSLFTFTLSLTIAASQCIASPSPHEDLPSKLNSSDPAHECASDVKIYGCYDKKGRLRGLHLDPHGCCPPDGILVMDFAISKPLLKHLATHDDHD